MTTPPDSPPPNKSALKKLGEFALENWKVAAGILCVLAALVLLFLSATCAYHSWGCPAGALAWLRLDWKLSYLLYSALICVGLSLAVTFGMGRGKAAEKAAAIWGSFAFALLLFFFLGASHNATEFLRFFLFGSIGAAAGYLTGVWLAPSSTSEESRLARVQGMIATLAAGAIGTKVLSLIDALTQVIPGKDPSIFQPQYYFPILTTLAGYLIALAAFYTLRTFNEGVVRITVQKGKLKSWIDGTNKGDNGIAAGQTVQFSAAADFADDISVSWTLNCKSEVATIPPPPTLTQTGALTAPAGDWINGNLNSLDWAVVAISNLDPSKSAFFDVHFIKPAAGN